MFCTRSPVGCNSENEFFYFFRSLLKCECNAGFYGNGITMCLRGQCRDESCPDNMKCVSSTRTDCTCEDGYELDNSINCIDIDECLLANECHENAECLNSGGSYSCNCRDTFSGDGKECFCEKGFVQTTDSNENDVCEDIDECLFENTSYTTTSGDRTSRGLTPTESFLFIIF